MHVATTAAQPFKFGKAGFVAGHRLSVDQAGGRLEAVHRLHDDRNALRPWPWRVKSLTPEAPRRASRRKAIVFYLVNPVATGWWPLDGARQARLDKVGEGPQTPQHVLLHAARGGRSR